MTTMLTADQSPAFVECFNRTCFMFDHKVHELDIFDLPNLLEASKRLPNAYYSTDGASVGDGWGSDVTEKPSLQQTIATLGESNSLVLMKGLADDPEFAPTFRDLVGELEAVVGEMLALDVSEARATLVMSSPHRVTPYHIDAETNFLFQLRGEKIVNVFDPNDRSLLTDAELERFYGGDVSAAQYKKDRQTDASVFDFAPGKGLHIPILAPHWVQNGDSVSVAISINCSLRSNQRVGRLYKFNNQMRKRGMTPSSPGASPMQDRLKLAAMGAFDYARRIRSGR